MLEAALNLLSKAKNKKDSVIPILKRIEKDDEEIHLVVEKFPLILRQVIG